MNDRSFGRETLPQDDRHGSKIYRRHNNIPSVLRKELCRLFFLYNDALVILSEGRSP